MGLAQGLLEKTGLFIAQVRNYVEADENSGIKKLVHMLIKKWLESVL